MTVHLYMSLIPEALIASMLSPEEFGAYYAVGTQRKQHGEAMFVELDINFRHEFFRIDEGLARCVPHADGSPKKSVYISTYRVLEHVDLSNFQKLYLVTSYGQTLGLERQHVLPEFTGPLYMYQEIAPVTPRVVSTLNPAEFHQFIIQDPESMIHLPAICFVDLKLGQLAKNPEFGEIQDLPYDNINYLRECLLELGNKNITTKMVNRVHSVEFPYRMINSGIYIGNANDLAFYPLPPLEELRSKYYRWWRSANY
ncbi:MAG: hypothetical protein D6835_00895 [Candidatus Thermofonsia bacterium]|nr:MAG: hypothetical protein D6835_00895 [Candidatus Thermofonsia bacterium]